MFERETWAARNRLTALPRSSAEALQWLPAQMLLNRLDIATIVISLDGIVVYANPACERLLGETAGGLEGRPLASLIGGKSKSLPQNWIDGLCDPSAVTNWSHRDGYPVATLALDPKILPDDYSMFMVSLQDVSDQVWPEVDRAFRMDPQRAK